MDMASLIYKSWNVILRTSNIDLKYTWLTADGTAC